jgi:hypothetical protein
MFMQTTEVWELYQKARDREREIARAEQRLRRVLRKVRLHLRKSRGKRQQKLFGTYYITDQAGIMPILRNVTLEWVEEQVATRPWSF